MTSLSKKTLAVAVAAALSGGASLALAQTVRPIVNTDQPGQALIYPYMTANSGWQSFLHVTNVSNTTVAAKVRFHAAKDSADVLDFIVVLSPYDMWTGVVEQSPAGEYGFRPTDNSCTVPVIGKDVFQKFLVQTSEVYAEVIMMGFSSATDKDTIASYAKHQAGMPANCGKIDEIFSDSSQLQQFDEFDHPLIPTSEGPHNFLTGKFDLVNVGKGWSGADRATVIMNFGAPPISNSNPSPYTAGPLFLDTNMWAQSPGDWDHPTLAEGYSGLDGINRFLTRSTVINEWVLNPNLGELSSWIVTFPTKKLTVDAISIYNDGLPVQGSSTEWPPFGDGPENCVAATARIWNREELMLQGGVSPGPSMPSLCYEANVINFKNGSIDSSSVLNSNVAVTFPTSYSTGVLAGWMSLAMPNNNVITNFGYPLRWTTLPGWASAVEGFETLQTSWRSGRPVVGFNITARTTPSDTVLYDHAYECKIDSGPNTETIQCGDNIN